MDGVVAVIGTLLGTLVGAFGTYFTQASIHRRQESAKQNALRRQIYVEWLTEIHEFFSQVRTASGKVRRQETTRTEHVEGLRRIPAEKAQVALEHLRLISQEDVAAAAARLWAHMRTHPVPAGTDRSPEGWRNWREDYWQLRRAFIDAARDEFGLDPFDWSKVAVDPGPFSAAHTRTE